MGKESIHSLGLKIKVSSKIKGNLFKEAREDQMRIFQSPEEETQVSEQNKLQDL